ncbi:hypothetical protein ACNJUT_22420, partial [Mycobacterium tuberculosis]
MVGAFATGAFAQAAKPAGPPPAATPAPAPSATPAPAAADAPVQTRQAQTVTIRRIVVQGN